MTWFSKESMSSANAAATCNICGGTEFVDFNGRSLVQCVKCKSLERHRIAIEVYKQFGLLDEGDGAKKYVLHLAPERMLANKLLSNKNLNYVASDPRTGSYNWTRIMRLFLPDDFKVFHDGYFDFILHNHVLEHIPGTYVDHLAEFQRILAPGGAMIFSIPGPAMARQTVEGGEHFETDAERLEKFGQEDHFKQFGGDLVETLEKTPGMNFSFDGIDEAGRAKLSIAKNSNRFLIWTKDK